MSPARTSSRCARYSLYPQQRPPHPRVALQTLIPLCRDVLSRKFENQSFDTLNVLAGSLERSDQVLTVRSFTAVAPLRRPCSTFALAPGPRFGNRPDATRHESAACVVATNKASLPGPDPCSPSVAVRHRTLQLALVIVASVNQGSLVAFFLRRDLFSTLVSFIADRETQHFAFEATLLLGLLANYRKAEARNPYGVRIEDFVEEGVMEVRRPLPS